MNHLKKAAFPSICVVMMIFNLLPQYLIKEKKGKKWRRVKRKKTTPKQLPSGKRTLVDLGKTIASLFI